LVIVGETHRALGRYDDALEYLDQALAIACDTGARTNQCLALKTIGDVYRALDRHDEASQYREHALTIARECGDRGAEARVLNSLGGIARSGGAPAKALDQYQEALTIAEETGGRYDQACAHLGLGDAYHDWMATTTLAITGNAHWSCTPACAFPKPPMHAPGSRMRPICP
jgi:tetratricopeptide (TPR) repeat protein